MCAVGILKYPIKRFKPFPGCLLYLPLSKMQAGTSPNLVNWNPDSPSTGWAANNAILSEVSNPVPPISAKALKILTNDPNGTGNAYTWMACVDYNKYPGLTATLKAYIYNLSTNIANQGRDFYDGVNWEAGGQLAKNDTWTLISNIGRIHTNANRLLTDFYSKLDASANTTDYLLVDAPLLTVPQMFDQSDYRRILHPEGWNLVSGGDAVDDFIGCESDFTTSALTIMLRMKPLDWGGLGGGIIADNGKFTFTMINDYTTIRFSSDGGSHIAYAANGAINLNAQQHIAVTRDANGLVNFFVNAKLSGTANQNSGTPSAGTTNLCIGNNLTGNRGFHGPFDEYQIYNRVLSLSEIQQDAARLR